MFLAGEYPMCRLVTFLMTCLVLATFFVPEAGVHIDFGFDQQVVKGNIDVQNHFAFLAARGQEEGCGDQEHKVRQVCEQDDQCEWSFQRCKEKDVCARPDPKPRQNVLLHRGAPAWTGLIYEAKNGRSLFDDDMLGYIDKFERILMSTANGAVKSSGVLSPWDEDWCLKAYPVGDDSHTGKCAATSSVLNMLSMNARNRQVTAQQVAEGFSTSGPLMCMCSDADALCSVCTPEGGLKGMDSLTSFSMDPMGAWPADVRSCILQYSVQNAAASAQRANQTQTESMCSRTLTGVAIQELLPMLASFCATKPTCQWEPPGSGGFCSSTAFYRATDADGLVQGAEKERVVTRICDERDLKWMGMRKAFLPASFDCQSEAKQVQFARTTFFPGGSTGSDAEGGNYERYINGLGGWLTSEQKLERQIEQESGGNLRVMLYSAATLRFQFLDILLFDMLMSITSFVLVWAYMWWTFESAFLASCAVFEILFSLLVAMCLWTVICGQRIQFFQMLTVYMILGIGAGDAFILQDACLQSGFLAGEEVASDWKSRFAWAYKRSFKATAVTTAATCGSFLIGACSPLPQVRDFCIFAAVVVFVDWVFCETFFALAIAVNVRSRMSRMGWRRGPGFFCILWRRCAPTCCKSLVGECPPPGAPPQKRAMERWFEGPLFNVLFKGRLGFIAAWGLVIIGMCVNAGMSLRTASKANPLGKQSLDVIRGAEILRGEFSAFGVPKVSMAWGLDAVQPMSEWGTTHASDTPSLSPASTAPLVTPEGQRELLSLCRAADRGRAEGNTRCDTSDCLINGNSLAGICQTNQDVLRQTGVYIPADILCQTGRYCFMEDFVRYWAWNESGCQNLQVGACATNLQCSWDGSINTCYPSKYDWDYIDYPGLPADEFLAMLKSPGYRMYNEARNDILKETGFGYIVTDERTLTGVKMNDKEITMAWVSFNATFRSENTVSEANAWYSRWDTYKTEAAPSIGGFHTAELWLFMVTQNEMVKAAVLGVGLSLLTAFLVLLVATRNWWVALFGLVNITGIAAMFLGIVPLIGWSLGENECIFLIAVVGLSVDYSVHLLHVYNCSKEEDRVGRAKDALSEVGISVTNSAITTLLASAVLFMCGFYFFIQLGACIFSGILFSILMSLFFLIPLLMVAGPQGAQGEFFAKRSQVKALELSADVCSAS